VIVEAPPAKMQPFAGRAVEKWPPKRLWRLKP
jgi:hypothetical protein